LSAGDELIIVVPTSGKNTSPEATAVFEFYMRAFAGVAMKTLLRTEPDEIKVRDLVAERHRLKREGRWFAEYPVRVKNYAERENFGRSYVNPAPVEQSWDQGAGINLSLCDYSTGMSVLMQLRHAGYLEVYRRTEPHLFLDDSFEFSNNTIVLRTLEAPFVRQLSFFHGCRFGTLGGSVEVLPCGCCIE
jgi:hypothetical protein